MELQGAMQADGCPPDCSKIFGSTQFETSRHDNLIGYISVFTEAVVAALFSMLHNEDDKDDVSRMNKFHVSTTAFSLKIQQIFDWAANHSPDSQELHEINKTWIYCKLVADFVRMVVEPLNLDECTAVDQLREIIVSNNGFVFETLCGIAELLGDRNVINTLDSSRKVKCWDFLEHYLSGYCFNPVVVGKSPGHDMLTIIVYLSSLDSEVGQTWAPEDDAGAEELQDILSPLLTAVNDNVEYFQLSTPCRVSLMSGVLGCGQCLDPEDPMALLLESYCMSTYETVDAYYKEIGIKSLTALDNAFSVLVMQAMEDRLLSQYKMLIPREIELLGITEGDAEKIKAGRRKLMTPAWKLLVEWADAAIPIIPEIADNLPCLTFLYAVAQGRVVMGEAAQEVAAGNHGSEETGDLIARGDTLLQTLINPTCEDVGTRPMQLFFMKHLSKRLGTQEAVNLLLSDQFTDKALGCPTLNLKDTLNPGGAHVPSTDPFYKLYSSTMYQDMRLKVRVAVRNGQVGVEELDTIVGDTATVEFFGPLVMSTHFEALLGHNSLMTSMRPGDKPEEFANHLAQWLENHSRSGTISSHMKELFNGVAHAGNGPKKFAAPFNIFDGISLEDSLTFQPIVHLAAKVFAHNADSTVVTGNILGPWNALLTDPGSLKDKWLPTMPEDEMAMIIGAIGGGETLGVYECSCGYKYVIGNCTMPQDSAACPQCGINIGAKRGGGFHEMTDGSRRLAVTGRTAWNSGANASSAGFSEVGVLGAEQAPKGYNVNGDKLDPNECYRELVPLSTRILRYFVHGCLAMACACDFGGVSAASAQELVPNASVDMFVKRMRDDFNFLKSHADNCTSATAYLYLHMIITNMSTDHCESDWTNNVQARSTAEKKFHQAYVASLFGDNNADATKEKLAEIRAGADSGAQQLALGAELAETTPPSQESFPQLLRYRQPVALDNFRFKLKQWNNDDYALLDTFVSNTQELRMAGDLHALLRMHNLVFKRYARTLTRAAAEKISFMDAIEAVPSERQEWAEAFEAYRRAWNTWAPDIIQFECHKKGEDWTGMPYIKETGGMNYTGQGNYTNNDADGWEGAARAKTIKLAVINGFDPGGPSSFDPDSCMLKLLVDKCLQIHNDRFIQRAHDLMDIHGIDRSPPQPLNLVSEADMIKFNMLDFEDAVRENATQSLKYGQGENVSYNYAAIQNWVLENVVGNVPTISVVAADFPWLGEGYSSKSVLGGITQEPLSEDLAGPIQYKDLTSITEQKVALDRLDECIGFMDILGAEDPNAGFAQYCVDALQVPASDMDDFGPPSSTIRNTLLLKHVVGVRELLYNLCEGGTSLLITISPIYGDELSSGNAEALRAVPGAIGAEGMEILMDAFENMLMKKFANFQEPVATKTQGAVTILASSYMMAPLDFATPPPDSLGGAKPKSLLEYDWYENFPSEIPVTQMKETYKFLKSL